jgi:phytoene/squalene synthetase
LSELLARCLGVADAGLIQRSRRCGLFCGGVYLLRDYGALLRRGFDPLPPAQAPLSTWGEHLRALQPARREAASLPLPLAIQARILAVLLREIADSGYDVRDQRIGLTPLRKLWTAWRTRRQNRFQPISRS